MASTERAPRSPVRRLLIHCVLAILVLIVWYSHMMWAFYSDEFRHNTNLKQLGISLQMYATEHPTGARELAPTLSRKPGHLMFEPEGFYAEYLDSAAFILISPADPEFSVTRGEDKDAAFYFEHCSYDYLGYMVWDDETVAAFAEAYKKRIQEGLPFDTDLPVPSPVTAIKRIDFGVYRQMVLDDQSDKPEWAYLKHPQSEIPVLIERPHPYPGMQGLFLGFANIPLSKPTVGGCVLYMDGHREFIPYPGKWPMTEKTVEIIKSLRSMKR